MGSKKSKKSQEGSASKAGDVEGKKGKPLSFDSELDALFAAAASSAVDPIPSSSQAVQPLQENVSKPSYADSEADEDDVESGLISIMRHTVNDVVHEDSDSDSEGDGKLIHETLRQQHKKKVKVPRNLDSESQSDRDSRSIFVGNLPISLVTDRPAIKLFRRHIISQSPYPSVTQIQSIRFRSIPFAKPTDDYDARHPEEAESKMRKRKRSQAYKESQADDEGVSSEKKTFLSGAQKRKVAFINQEINDKADFVNAYVTLSQFSEDTVKKIQEQYGEQKAARLTPVVIAALLARSAHNTVFSGRHLRVDLVKSLTPQDIVQSGLDKIRTADGGMIGAMAGGSSVDQEARRRTLFVGNMDFEIREEEVRTFFDGLVTAERGQAPSAKVLDFSRCTLLPAPEIDASTEEEGGAAERSWVQDVRIIRDAATQMGKGFSYVRFLDAECVDEVIAMHESEEAVLAAAKTGKGAVSLPNDFRRKLKLKGRPLRVSRCRTSKGNVTTSRIHGTPKASANGKARSTPPAQRSRSTGAPTPGGTSPFAKRQKLQDNRAVNGSPTRKPKESKPIPNPPPRNTDPLRIAEVARKKADPERQARRMAKKSAKRTQQKLQAVAKEAGGTSGRVPLKVKAKSGAGDKDSKKHRPRKSNSTKSHGRPKASTSSRLVSTMTMLAALFALVAVPGVTGNNEIVNFGPIMCPANEIGHLQDRAARQISRTWPLIRPLTGAKLFTLDPYTQPDVWLALALVADEDDLDGALLDDDRVVSVSDLATKAFPLLSDAIRSDKSPRDRWLENVVPWLKWHLWQKRFSFRVDWPANWPLKVTATVHDAASMLAAGKVSWQANEHTFDMHRRSPDDNFEAQLWPCARLYVHVHVESFYVPLPMATKGVQAIEVHSVKDWLFKAFVYVGELYLAPLTNEHLGGPYADDSIPTSMPVPANLVLEPVYIGFVPHTALGLLAIMIPALLAVYYFVAPLVGKVLEESIESDIRAFQMEEEAQQRKTQ